MSLGVVAWLLVCYAQFQSGLAPIGDYLYGVKALRQVQQVDLLMSRPCIL